MTAVIERKTSEEPDSGRGAAADGTASAPKATQAPVADFTVNLDESFAGHGTPKDKERTASSVAPSHCGAEMTMSPDPDASLPWAQFHTGLGEWVCPCGFRQDVAPVADPLAAVRAASGRLESLQWEMDAAQAALATAVRAADQAGAERSSLGVAAAISAAELEDMLA
ncbi:hypothetical protein [Arthrobacter sp. NPDC080082]|uniref:hypothetical protein n=1 Tax=unclassified Arthrobacter TaxID=235627 RepID=UPI0034450D3A